MTASPTFRLVFAGTPEVAVPSLRALQDAGHDIAAVVTRPDAPQGRKRVLTPSPVAAEAERLGLRVIKASRLDDDTTAEIVALGADLGVVVAYGGLVREPLLSAPTHGWINLHFSLLPRWRGAAPVQHALIAGDDELGTAVFRLVRELDAGAVYAQAPVRLPVNATAGEALDVLAEVGADQLVGVVASIAAGTAVATPQDGTVTLAPKLRLEDGALDWTQPAARVLARWRGVTPEPGAHTTVGDARVKVLTMEHAQDAPALAPGEPASSKRGVLVGTGTDPLLVTRVQPSGRGPMSASDWLRGLRDEAWFGA